MSRTTSSRFPVAAACAVVLVASPLALAQVNGAKRGANAPAAVNAAGAAAALPMPHGIVPSRAELPGSAFLKLDAANKGYVTMEDAAQLSGFESAFRQADQNHDGRLNESEFNSAWAIYTGMTP